MSVFNRIASAFGYEKRSSLESPQTPLSFPAEWLLDLFNGGRTDSGVRISELTALQVSTVFACVNIVSNGLSSLPFHVYERVHKGASAGKQIAYQHNLWDLLHNEPNEEMTSVTFLKTLMVHGLLWGNLYAEIERDKRDNSIKGLWPRNPARTRPIRLVKPTEIEGDLLPAGTLLFETTESVLTSDGAAITDDNHIGKRRIILAEDMVHVPGLSLDGRLGQSTIWLSRQIMGLALASEKYAAKFFGNGGRPAGLLTIPSALTPVAMEQLKRSWQEAHGGENAWKLAVLEAGTKYEKISATPNEGQLLETRSFQRAEICAVFNVPLHMVAASEKAGKSNVEQSSIEFVLYCLQPWVTSFEQEFSRKLFPKIGRTANRYFVHFDTRRLLYPDAEARSKFYGSGKQWGYLNTDDIRDLENMNPVGGDVGQAFWMPVNMQDASDPITPGLNAQKDFVKKNPDHSQLVLNAPQRPEEDNDSENEPTVLKAKKGTAGKAKPSPKTKRALYSLPESGNVPEYIMRHGTTDANEQGVYRGHGAYALDADGRAIAQKAAEFLKDKGIRRIVTSTLVRHTQTAQIVSSVLGAIPVEHDDNLRSLDVGIFTGHKRDDVGEELQWYLDNADEIIPGGESLNDLRNRTVAGFAKVRAANGSTGPTLVITSRSNIYMLKEAGIGGSEKKVAEPGGVYRLDGINLHLIFGEEIVDSLSS